MAEAARARVALDEDVRPLLARLLRDRGWDAVSLVDARRTGLSDEEQLAWAMTARRVLVTHNAADFARIAASWSRDSRSHAGIVIAHQGPLGWLLRAVIAALVSRPDAADWKNQVVWTGRPMRRT